MLSWEEYVELTNMRRRGMPISAIARHVGMDRKTIRKYLNNPDLKPGERKQSPKLVGPYLHYVEARLEDNHHVAGTVLLRELAELGYAGSYETLARHLKLVRPSCDFCSESELPESVMMKHPPGSAQADWSPYFWTPSGSSSEIEVQLFGIELSRPRVIYAEFFERQGWAHLALGHEHAFDYFGATPTSIRYDRTTQVFRAGSDEPTAQWADFAAHHGFAVVPCPKGRGRSKGQIERAFSYVDTSFFATADAATLPELNLKLRRWLDETANKRTSADITTAPLDALEEERPHLLAVRRPGYLLEVSVERKVDSYCLVRFEGARYSVEPGNVGRMVFVVTRPGSDRLEIRCGAWVIGAHSFVPRGEISFDPAHGKAIEAMTLASLSKAGRAHKRKRNDAVIGPRALEEAAIIRARSALGTDLEVESRDLSIYDEVWQ